MLVKTTATTWIHDMMIKHNTLYQYNFNQTQNVFVDMHELKTSYWQDDNENLNLTSASWISFNIYDDFNFFDCDVDDFQYHMILFNILSESFNIFIYDSAFWIFFNNHSSSDDQSCKNTCQINEYNVVNIKSFYWFNVSIHSMINMIMKNKAVLVSAINNSRL